MWFALRTDDVTFWIVDAFPGDAERQAHLGGEIAKALMANAERLLAEPPELGMADVLAAKVPADRPERSHRRDWPLSRHPRVLAAPVRGGAVTHVRWRAMSEQIPLVDYLVLGDKPHLVATQCTNCGATYFDRRNACAGCFGTDFKQVPVSTEGTVNTYTIVAMAAPGIPVPFVSAVVDCDGIPVRGQHHQRGAGPGPRLDGHEGAPGDLLARRGRPRQGSHRLRVRAGKQLRAALGRVGRCERASASERVTNNGLRGRGTQ